MTDSERKPEDGEYVLVVAHYCEMAQRVGRVISISEDTGDSMPYMVRFSHNRREWPFSAEELEALGSEKPMTDDNGRLITREEAMTKPADSDQTEKARRERAATMLLDDIVSKPSTPSCFTDFSTEIRELMCRFAASERQAVIEECCRAVCSGCKDQHYYLDR